jgi:hypothetical protein
MTARIVPVILTCERNLGVTRKFVGALRTIRRALPPPVVVVDLSCMERVTGEYLSLVAALDPQSVYFHPREAGATCDYDSVQYAANFALEKALAEAGADDYVLFMEDDITFSTRFVEKIRSLYLGAETGFVTLYQPGSGYGFHILDPERFYGTQCVMFTRRAVAEIIANREEMMKNFRPGYDIRWSRFLASRGYTLYCTDHSYVQHLPSVSRLHGLGSHTSYNFVR